MLSLITATPMGRRVLARTARPRCTGTAHRLEVVRQHDALHRARRARFVVGQLRKRSATAKRPAPVVVGGGSAPRHRAHPGRRLQPALQLLEVRDARGRGPEVLAAQRGAGLSRSCRRRSRAHLSRPTKLRSRSAAADTTTTARRPRRRRRLAQPAGLPPLPPRPPSRNRTRSSPRGAAEQAEEHTRRERDQDREGDTRRSTPTRVRNSTLAVVGMSFARAEHPEASAAPSRPRSRDKSRLSTRSCATMRERLAPSAVRIHPSWTRSLARARVKLATLARDQQHQADRSSDPARGAERADRRSSTTTASPPPTSGRCWTGTAPPDVPRPPPSPPARRRASARDSIGRKPWSLGCGARCAATRTGLGSKALAAPRRDARSRRRGASRRSRCTAARRA